MRILWFVVMGYVLIINIIGFMIMGIDKSRAKRNQWRIRENTLFFIAAIGGSIGSILGMKNFHHKTKHNSFKYGMPCILILQIACILLLYIMN